MNLLKLLSATHAIGTIREKPTAFVTETLPSFGWERLAANSGGSQVKRGVQGLLRALWPFSRKPAGLRVEISTTSANHAGDVPSGIRAGPRWGRRQTLDPVQRELAFEALKPIRNDLRDEDFEVTTVLGVTRGRVGRKPASQASQHPAVLPEQPLLSLEQSTR